MTLQVLRAAACPDDLRWMQAALQQAQLAAGAGEVPVGAVVVCHGQIVGRGYNQPVGTHDPSAHAEVQALRDAARRLGNYRLEDCTLYVTLEPCAMCAGAILHARVARVVWGAAEPRMGAAGSIVDLFANSQLNHHTQTTAGVLADAAADMLTAFFAQRRQVQQAVAKAAHPLRDDALRTPEKCFSACCDSAGSSFFYSDWPALNGLRLHVKDSEASSAPSAITWLMLPASPAPQSLFRHLAVGLQAQGDRVVAPDWLGFGRSDKPKKDSAINDSRQLSVLLDLVEFLAIPAGQPLVVAAHGDASRLALALVAALAKRNLVSSAALWLINPLLAGHATLAYLDWLQQVQRKPMLDLAQACATSAADDVSTDDRAQWQVQFPDKGYRAGLRAWARDALEWAGGAQIDQRAWPACSQISWGDSALWWPAAEVAQQVPQHRAAGGDWLPLQNPAALLQAASFFRK
ncbi:MAG: tRNA adenosine(34) deaminase TadA [Comamonas sp.]